jgi:hypothetical protein
MRVRSLVIALLLFSLFVPAAGAIYIPGQTIPDDGLMHIMSAETGTDAPVASPGSTLFPSLVSPISAISVPGAGQTGPYSMFSQGITSGAFAGFPALAGGSVPPAMPGSPTGSFSIPSINMPAPDSEGNIDIGDTIGHIVPPMQPGYWDNIKDMDLHTNMPVIGL